MAKILVIDDVKEVTDSIRRFLELRDHTVCTAENGLDGLRLYKSFNPDLIITDVYMPEMEGLETIRAIREIDKDIPMIVISGAEDLYVETGLKFGAICALSKPFEPEYLESAIQFSLSSRIT